MNDKTGKVIFQIVRKWAFPGALLPYKLFINGEYVGSLKNGKTLITEVTKSDYYFIDSMYGIDERNGIICASDLNDPSQVFVEIQCAGGFKTVVYYKFFALKNGEYLELPSFNYSRYYAACYNEELYSGLTKQEKIFTRCLQFFNEVSDAADEVLFDDKVLEMLDALKCIGATQYTHVFSYIAEHILSDILLPLTDEAENDKDLLQRMNAANQVVWDSEKNGSAEELHKCLVKYIIKNLLEKRQ